MQQLTQKLKRGNITINQSPVPVNGNGQLLVKNHYSLISAGTEGSTVKTARKGYIGKAKERPEQVRQVLQTLKTQGPVQTYRAVMKNSIPILIGFNPGATLSGKIMEAERVLGNISIGFGNHPFHTDGVIKNPSLIVDGQ